MNKQLLNWAFLFIIITAESLLCSMMHDNHPIFSGHKDFFPHEENQSDNQSEDDELGALEETEELVLVEPPLESHELPQRATTPAFSCGGHERRLSLSGSSAPDEATYEGGGAAADLTNTTRNVATELGYYSSWAAKVAVAGLAKVAYEAMHRIDKTTTHGKIAYVTAEANKEIHTKLLHLAQTQTLEWLIQSDDYHKLARQSRDRAYAAEEVIQYIVLPVISDTTQSYEEIKKAIILVQRIVECNKDALLPHTLYLAQMCIAKGNALLPSPSPRLQSVPA